MIAKMPEFYLERNDEWAEVCMKLTGGDAEGCGSRLDTRNQLNSLADRYIRSFGGKIVGRIYTEMDNPSDTTFYKVGENRIRVRYFTFVSEHPWPFDYPERETLQVKVWGKNPIRLVNLLKKNLSLTESENKRAA